MKITQMLTKVFTINFNSITFIINAQFTVELNWLLYFADYTGVETNARTKVDTKRN